MLRTIIIDDEAHVRKTISNLVGTYCPNLQIAGYGDSVRTGLEAIKKYNPDLVLLDIKMKDGTGFDLLKKINSIDFKIIFITAYDQFAVQAFKFSAIDYLLKPVDPEDLVTAVEKAEQMHKKDLQTQLKALEENLESKIRRIRGIRVLCKKVTIPLFTKIFGKCKGLLLPYPLLRSPQITALMINVMLKKQDVIIFDSLIQKRFFLLKCHQRLHIIRHDPWQRDVCY